VVCVPYVDWGCFSLSETEVKFLPLYNFLICRYPNKFERELINYLFNSVFTKPFLLFYGAGFIFILKKTQIEILEFLHYRKTCTVR
jgi:hypothetical protein